MAGGRDINNTPAPKRFQCAAGRIYFSKGLERNLFFILTLGMLVCGLLAKLGWL